MNKEALKDPLKFVWLSTIDRWAADVFNGSTFIQKETICTFLLQKMALINLTGLQQVIMPTVAILNWGNILFEGCPGD